MCGVIHEEKKTNGWRKKAAALRSFLIINERTVGSSSETADFRVMDKERRPQLLSLVRRCSRCCGGQLTDRRTTTSPRTRRHARETAARCVGTSVCGTVRVPTCVFADCVRLRRWRSDGKILCANVVVVAGGEKGYAATAVVFVAVIRAVAWGRWTCFFFFCRALLLSSPTKCTDSPTKAVYEQLLLIRMCCDKNAPTQRNLGMITVAGKILNNRYPEKNQIRLLDASRSVYCFRRLWYAHCALITMK